MASWVSLSDESFALRLSSVKAMLQTIITYTVATDGDLARDLQPAQNSNTTRRENEVSRCTPPIPAASVWLRCDYCNDGRLMVKEEEELEVSFHDTLTAVRGNVAPRMPSARRQRPVTATIIDTQLQHTTYLSNQLLTCHF